MTESEAVILRREIAAAFGRNDALEKEIAELKKKLAKFEKENAELKRKLGMYESPHMPTSKPSLYNDERKEFRKRRNEDPGGNPGDKARGKKRGPPKGHKGTSHNHTPEKTILFVLAIMTCVCGKTLMRKPDINKLVIDFDKSGVIRIANAIIQNAECECGMKVYAPTPLINGTSLGPNMLGMIMNLFEMANTDAWIAWFLHATYGFKVSESTIGKARAAVARSQQGVIETIKARIQVRPWVQLDETMLKRGDGHYGYVWVVHCKEATYVHFSTTRTLAVLEAHFAWLKGCAVVCDGYGGYPTMFRIIQRCLRHILATAEKTAVKNEIDENAYNAFLSFYNRIKHRKTHGPLENMEFSREVYNIAMSFQDESIKTTIINAIPHMFTFMAYEGMPPHNNGAEVEIRDGVVRQRNVRHKIVTQESRDVFSANLTVTRTARKQGLSPGRVIIELAKNKDWNIFKHDPDTPFSMVESDGTRYSIFDVPGPPTCSGVRQNRTAAVSASTA